jgi:hypothetical protein
MLRNLFVQSKADGWSKVPQAALVFWIIKILATTLGETGGDAHHLFPGNCRRHDHPYRRDLTPQTCGAGLKA